MEAGSRVGIDYAIAMLTNPRKAYRLSRPVSKPLWRQYDYGKLVLSPRASVNPTSLLTGEPPRGWLTAVGVKLVKELVEWAEVGEIDILHLDPLSRECQLAAPHSQPVDWRIVPFNKAEECSLPDRWYKSATEYGARRQFDADRQNKGLSISLCTQEPLPAPRQQAARRRHVSIS